MSCALVWKPVSKKTNRAGDIQLREIIGNKYGYPCVLTQGALTYLGALMDAGVEGAEILFDAVEKYDEIDVDLEC